MRPFQGTFGTLVLSALLAANLAACKPSASVDAAQNKTEGAKFLAENRTKPGIQTTASGLQYQVLKEGTGASPKATDVVRVNYKGSLINGNSFDSGEGIQFPLNRVIPGWTEGLQLMKEGASYRFFIPSELAYGPAGAGGVIPPDATLIFDVDLVKVGPS